MSWAQQIHPLVSEEVNIAVVGDSEVGKSTLIGRYCQGTFTNRYVPTVGIDIDTRIVMVDGRLIRVNIWDISGQDGFIWAGRKQLSAAEGFLFVYDITNMASFKNMSKWLTSVQKVAGNKDLPKVLVGNKSDLRHQQVVGAAQAKEFGIPEGMRHVEVSARLDKWLNVAFHLLVSEALRYRTLGCVMPMGQPSWVRVADAEAHEAEAMIIDAQPVDDGPEYRHLFKIMLVGAPRTGKTCLRYRFCKDHYCPEYVATAGFDFSSRTLLMEGDRVKVQVWDVAGDDVYENTRRGYYRGANAFVITYDVTNPASFAEAERLLKELSMDGCDQSPKVIVGNKVDMGRRKQVDYAMAREFADGWRVPLVEVSSRYGNNVDVAFNKLLVALKRKLAPWKQIYDFS